MESRRPLNTSASREPQGFFQLSQAHLNLLTTCPRKFQHFYLDQLGLPQLEPERQVLGAQFHRLMQQQELGLPIAELVEADPQLQRWFDAFVQAPPQMLEGDRQSEHRRTLCFQNYLLTGIYDLLILGQHQAQILDWKTYEHPPQPRQLRQSWQTRLYLYILAETSDYSPEQISMTYWFAESRPQRSEPRSLTFAYAAEHHAQTQQDLQQILSNLTDWLTCGSFPQVEIAAGHCEGRHADSGANQGDLHCRFAIRCQRHETETLPILSTIDSIPELPL